jgi:hypothetical protein
MFGALLYDFVYYINFYEVNTICKISAYCLKIIGPCPPCARAGWRGVSHDGRVDKRLEYAEM